MKKLMMITAGFAVGALLCAPVVFAQPEDSAKRGGRTNEKAQQVKKRPALIVGQTAPSFALKSLDGKSETDTSSFRGQRPIILFFGSYT